MVTLKVLKKVGKVIDVGVHEVNDLVFAKQLIEKGLAELISGEFPQKKVPSPTKKKGAKK